MPTGNIKRTAGTYKNLLPVLLKSHNSMDYLPMNNGGS
jgi:hypothetical protein